MDHYFSENPTASHAFGSFPVTCEGHALTFATDSAVFSRRRLDPGTHLLLETVLSLEGDRPAAVLDLGTGTGVLAVALATCRPSFRVTGSDVNTRAVELARRNAAENGVSGVEFLLADGVPEGSGPFDLIITNPPIRAGKAVVYRLFHEATDHLQEDGAFYTVIRVRQGAASAKEALERYYRHVETVARSKGYHVLRATDKTEERRP